MGSNGRSERSTAVTPAWSTSARDGEGIFGRGGSRHSCSTSHICSPPRVCVRLTRSPATADSRLRALVQKDLAAIAALEKKRHQAHQGRRHAIASDTHAPSPAIQSRVSAQTPCHHGSVQRDYVRRVGDCRGVGWRALRPFESNSLRSSLLLPLFRKGAQAMSIHEKTNQRTTKAAKGGRSVSDGRTAATHEKRPSAAIASVAKSDAKSSRSQPTAKKPAQKPRSTPRAKQPLASRNPELRVTDTLGCTETFAWDLPD